MGDRLVELGRLLLIGVGLAAVVVVAVALTPLRFELLYYGGRGTQGIRTLSRGPSALLSLGAIYGLVRLLLDISAARRRR